ncbi:MAG: NAD(P)H-hydrate dehydratase [Leptolyngbyaceae bacterium]|nr:NAD(P)H-hydrate dehydratase [Leptolyngbyaceae bacterium]
MTSTSLQLLKSSISQAMKNQARSPLIQQTIVTAEQMQAIEARIFAAGMPVTALMEKVAGRITAKINELYPLSPECKRVGVLVGPGHNGGDALVVARELHFRGYEVSCYQPFQRLKELTATHAQYVSSLGIPLVKEIGSLGECQLLIDGWFGFGLSRDLADPVFSAIATLNQWHIPTVSIDLPSGIHTDTGAVMGTAVQATHTLCLGLWKRAFLQDQALPYIGQAHLIDLDIPLADITAILGSEPVIRRLTPSIVAESLPLPRSPITHKYKEGHALLICGSQRYMGAAILAGLAARSSGVGMLSIAVPAGLKLAIALRIPDAVIIACPETETGAIDQLPDFVDLAKYDAIACGPGLTLDALSVVQTVLDASPPLLLDADGLNALATIGVEAIAHRPDPTVITPHLGEFRRLFPALGEELVQGGDRITIVQAAAQQSGAILVLKGARTVIATPSDRLWVNPESSPALARGGSGDVLTGLMVGLMAQAIAHRAPSDPSQQSCAIEPIVATAVWCHAQAGMVACEQRGERGVDAETLTQFLRPILL